METYSPFDQLKLLEILELCNGFYRCPKDAAGNRTGKLVGYAGKYDAPDGSKKQYVGDVYANSAMAERQSRVLDHFAFNLCQLSHEVLGSRIFKGVQSFCGAPEGGKALALALADRARKQYFYPEKKVIAVKTESSREISELVFDRHEPDEGTTVLIVEDVCNNFSTTAELIALIESKGASVAGILCFLNRSIEVDGEYQVREELTLPVISLVREIIPQYRQNDPAVAADIEAGRVVWKPKNEWSKLKAAVGNTA